MKNIAIQGDPGSFHHAAAQSWYGETFAIVPCKTFKDVFIALQDGSASSAVVAIENSLHGSINEVYDLLLKYKFPIVGEVAERIHQCLIGLPNAEISDITAVYSHPVALSQCSEYLDTTLPLADRHESYDTAGSVEYIKTVDDKHQAAIASKLAAKLHGMKVLKSNIQNHDTNYTRFLILEPNVTPNKLANKASLVIETDHRPGALFEALAIINTHAANMTKLQSRPIPTKVWRYMFYIDIEVSPSDATNIVTELKANSCKTTLLGTYPKATTELDI